jgi:hypothetical protein
MNVDDAITVLVHPNPRRSAVLTVGDYLARAIAARLRGDVTTAQMQEEMAWSTIGCTDAIFDEHLLELAVRFARQGQVEQAQAAVQRSRVGAWGQSFEGRRRIKTTLEEIEKWHRAQLEDPAVIMSTAARYARV